MVKHYDTIIVGAGAAGLSCARMLREAGKTVLVLEARARAGGRMHTFMQGPVPVELGAEFIHGADKNFLAELHRAKVPFVDVIENRFYLKGKKLVKKKDFWEELEKITSKMGKNLKSDRPVADFLKTHKMKPAMRQLFINYLEGFHAADVELMSERVLAATEKEDIDDLNGIEQFRPLTGYKTLVDYWVGEGSHGDWLQLESIVKAVQWKKGEVNIYGTPFSSVRAKSAVITVPIGVLKKNHSLSGIEIDPHPVELAKALECVHMGYIERMTFEFKTRFWEDLTKEPIGFIHSALGDYFSTWWTQYPRRTPLLTAWQGGGKAFELAHWPVEKQVREALKTLAGITGKSTAFLRSNLEGFHLHNWASDPFSLGAYSYVGIDGEKKSARLARPFEDTLFFAGEGTASNYARATVHGARETGLRAARQILNILG